MQVSVIFKEGDFGLCDNDVRSSYVVVLQLLAWFDVNNTSD